MNIGYQATRKKNILLFSLLIGGITLIINPSYLFATKGYENKTAQIENKITALTQRTQEFSGPEHFLLSFIEGSGLSYDLTDKIELKLPGNVKVEYKWNFGGAGDIFTPFPVVKPLIKFDGNKEKALFDSYNFILNGQRPSSGFGNVAKTLGMSLVKDKLLGGSKLLDNFTISPEFLFFIKMILLVRDPFYAENFIKMRNEIVLLLIRLMITVSEIANVEGTIIKINTFLNVLNKFLSDQFPFLNLDFFSSAIDTLIFIKSGKGEIDVFNYEPQAHVFVFSKKDEAFAACEYLSSKIEKTSKISDLGNSLKELCKKRGTWVSSLPEFMKLSNSSYSPSFSIVTSVDGISDYLRNKYIAEEEFGDYESYYTSNTGLEIYVKQNKKDKNWYLTIKSKYLDDADTWKLFWVSVIQLIRDYRSARERFLKESLVDNDQKNKTKDEQEKDLYFSKYSSFSSLPVGKEFTKKLNLKIEEMEKRRKFYNSKDRKKLVGRRIADLEKKLRMLEEKEKFLLEILSQNKSVKRNNFSDLDIKANTEGKLEGAMNFLFNKNSGDETNKVMSEYVGIGAEVNETLLKDW